MEKNAKTALTQLTGYLTLLFCLLFQGTAQARSASSQYPIMTCKVHGGGPNNSKTIRVFANQERFTWVRYGNKNYQITRIENVPTSSGDLGYAFIARNRHHFIKVIGKKSFHLMQTQLREGIHSKKNADRVIRSASLICQNDLPN